MHIEVCTQSAATTTVPYLNNGLCAPHQKHRLYSNVSAVRFFRDVEQERKGVTAESTSQFHI